MRHQCARQLISAKICCLLALFTFHTSLLVCLNGLLLVAHIVALRFGISLHPKHFGATQHHMHTLHKVSNNASFLACLHSAPTQNREPNAQGNTKKDSLSSPLLGSSRQLSSLVDLSAHCFVQHSLAHAPLPLLCLLCISNHFDHVLLLI